MFQPSTVPMRHVSSVGAYFAHEIPIPYIAQSKYLSAILPFLIKFWFNAYATKLG